MCNGGSTSDRRFAFPITKRTAALLLALACAVHAQETPAPQPTSSTAKAIPISFVPPPMDGTISLGIYDAKGTATSASTFHLIMPSPSRATRRRDSLA
jgi:hypothetical protein